jgi:hypothetical protein
MPVANVAEGRDFVMGIIKVAWDASIAPGGYTGTWPPSIFYQDVVGDPPEAAPYAHAFIQHRKGGQVAIGDAGLRRFRADGIVTVALYTPHGDGLTLADYLANIVQDALEAHHTPDKVYFRDVRVVDDGKDGTNSKVRVIADLDYDRVK